MTKPLAVGVAGLGTVGAGVLTLLRDNAATVAARAGRPIAVTAVSSRDRTQGPRRAARRPALVRGPRRARRRPARRRRRGDASAARRARPPTWSAPRSPPASPWSPPTRRCSRSMAPSSRSSPRRSASPLMFEAAVAGGIPAIKAVREGLAANDLSRVARHPERHLQLHPDHDARARPRIRRSAGRGAEARLRRGRPVLRRGRHRRRPQAGDPGGARLRPPGGFRRRACRGHPQRQRARHRAGRANSATASSCSASRGATEHGIETRVHPCMVPVAHPIARVDGVFNAVVAEGDFVGRVVLEGRGAGAGPTASAVVADLIDIARGRRTPVWGVSRRRAVRAALASRWKSASAPTTCG